MYSEKARLRRYEDDLNVSGSGVIIMGVWGIVRVLIELFLGAEDSIKIEDEDPFVRIAGTVIMFAIIAAVSFVVMKIHFYIGFNAIKAARGSEYKKGYFIAAILMFIFSILGMVTYKEEFQNLENLDTTIASIMVDLTTIYIFGVVIISTIKIRELRKERFQE